IENVVQRLKDQKYLNDSSYAAAYSAFRRDNEKFGRRRVVTDLKVKGVHGDVITKAVDDAYRDVNEPEQARAFLKRKRLQKPQRSFAPFCAPALGWQPRCRCLRAGMLMMR